MWASWNFPLWGWGEREKGRKGENFYFPIILYTLPKNSIKKSKSFSYLSPDPFWVGFCFRCSLDFPTFRSSIHFWNWSPISWFLLFLWCGLQFCGIWLNTLHSFFWVLFVLSSSMSWKLWSWWLKFWCLWIEKLLVAFWVLWVSRNWVWVILFEIEEPLLVQWFSIFLVELVVVVVVMMVIDG